MNKEDAMKDRIDELKRTIQHLCNGIVNSIEYIKDDPLFAELMLKELISDNRFEYK